MLSTEVTAPNISNTRITTASVCCMLTLSTQCPFYFIPLGNVNEFSSGLRTGY